MPHNDIQKQTDLAIRDFRGERGLSQASLAEKAGLNRTYLNGGEAGKRNLSLKTIGQIANALEVPIAELFEWSTK